MAFSEVPFGVKFMYQGCLCERYSPGFPDENMAVNVVDLGTRQRYFFSGDVEVVAWMPKALLAQREKEKSLEWQQKWREAQERLRNRDWYEEPELIIDGEKNRELRFIPVR